MLDKKSEFIKTKLSGKIFLFIACLLVIALSVVLPAGHVFAQDFNKKVLAEIAGEKITVGEFIQVFRKNNNQGEEPDQNSVKEYLDLYVNFRLKV
ncbi:MAG: hypothetical protein Q8M23_02545, partial [Bacteroidales bacterium]|nr:hypothetical protein [Bacteroidales bacterium]